jgi:hypothetical protein
MGAAAFWLLCGWLRFVYYGMAAPPEAALVGWGKPWLLQDDCGLIAMVQLPSGHYGVAAFWPFLLRSAYSAHVTVLSVLDSALAATAPPRTAPPSLGVCVPRGGH